MSKLISIPNKRFLKETNIKNYIKNTFDVDDENINNFIRNLGKNLKEKSLMNSKRKDKNNNSESEESYQLCFSESDFSEHETYFRQKKNNKHFYFPDLQYEDSMQQQFKMFCDILEQDNQLFIRHLVQIDDFYRLFDPNYNPVF